MSKIEEILFTWKLNYGVKRSRYSLTREIPYGDRFIRLGHLVRELRTTHGYKKTDFNPEVMNKIVATCVNGATYDRGKLKRWREAVQNDINKLLTKYFPDEYIQDQRLNDSSPEIPVIGNLRLAKAK